MAGNVWPVDAVTGAPSYSGRILRQMLSILVGGGTSARPLAGGSGVNERTSKTTTVTATSTTWTMAPHGGYIDAEASASAGGYFYTFQSNETGSMTAANATNPRIDLLSVRIDDPAEGDGTSVPTAVPEYTTGTAAPSPTAPATPARCMALAQINVPVSGGGSPTVTWVAPILRAAGSPVPVVAPAPQTITGGNGTLTITHGLAFTPSAVIASVAYSGSTPLHAQVFSISSTQVVLRIYRVSDGSAQPDGSVAALGIHLSCFP